MNITQYEKMKQHLSDVDTGPFTLNEFTFYRSLYSYSCV